MGKAVPKKVKSMVRDLLKIFPEGKFTDDFSHNKKVITEELKIPLATEQRNLVAGFMVRKMKRAKAA